MREDLLDNLEFFSNITQETLSAFHISGVDSDLYENVQELKRAITKSTTRKLKNIVHDKENNKYIRYFTDGFVDKVDDTDVNTPSHYENSEIFKRLVHKPNPITSIKLGKIETIRNRNVHSTIERLFFSSE